MGRSLIINRHFYGSTLFGCGQVAEHKLRRAILFRLFPDAVNIAGADSYLAVRVIRGKGLDEPHIQSQLSAVIGDAKHIVHMGIDAAATISYVFPAPTSWASKVFPPYKMCAMALI